MGEEESKKEEEIWELMDVCGEEILRRLSGKDLQGLKTVCKDWIKLFRSPYFIRLHLWTPNYETRIRVLKPLFNLYDKKEEDEIRGGIDDYDNYYSNCDSKQRILPYPRGMSNWETIIIGSVDGLICLLEARLDIERERERGVFRFKIAIYNPSTRKVFRVQLRTFFHIYRCWFGSCSGVGEYILGMLRHISGTRYELGVYKLTRSFTNLICIQSMFVDLHAPGGFIYRPNFTDYRGVRAVHWCIARSNSHIIDGQYYRTTTHAIIAYHLETNSHVEFLPPLQYADFRLGVVDGCLCATLKKDRDSVFELWIRKKLEWIKYANIHGFNDSANMFPLGFFPNTGDLLFDLGSKLIKYNFFNRNRPPMLLKDYGPIAFSCSSRTAIICADSLLYPSLSPL